MRNLFNGFLCTMRIWHLKNQEVYSVYLVKPKLSWHYYVFLYDPSIITSQWFHFSRNSGVFRKFWDFQGLKKKFKKIENREKNNLELVASYTIDIEDLEPFLKFQDILWNSRNFQSLFQDIYFWKVVALLHHLFLADIHRKLVQVMELGKQWSPSTNEPTVV